MSPVPIKKAFYPEPEVARVLSHAPPKKLSDWVNRLILKGLEWELREKLARDYAAYDRALAREGGEEHAGKSARSSRRAELERLFTPEDETNDWY